ncbi:pentapeptide repeat-containing protein [Aetokthonos hydrillicola Thurmond2011]|jgi:hypothetical protein|uniref:Pentapeptide repeat-containing protein n=1 Tax=Aetokthonos hydrillicola Thurmond2011 TaxID=2712845 RepID=A0AAP5IIS7_9CYAN|nr:pentapeptide repeat-containing protein [Aetokthonos hydrillicola]MBO3463028.1 hypothetical protein [Aetokthonos hydrillicola CCALA 1050]MDR9900870.1 pentapeptide repeat-containing protein [Aetokthonos hydrillicola Thurmond2011]
MIYTFYSYKGGVGRSMSLANVAELFYQAGLKVLIVDWDLEAPGIERFFPINHEEFSTKPGLMDMLLDYKQQMTQDFSISGDEDDLPFKNLKEFIVDVYTNVQEKGELWILSAGRRSKDNFSDYANTVRTFDWGDFYQNWEGELYFEWLRQQFEIIADVVLIDSRTGVTEMGGVCTYQLADVIVMLCSANQQCLEGTYKMFLDFKRPQVQEIRERTLEVVVVPARIDNTESDLLDSFQRDFIKLFSKYIPKSIGSRSDIFWQLAIPYVPRYAYQETLAIREKQKAHAKNLVDAFTQLAFVISRLAPENSLLRLAFPETEIKIGNATIVGSMITGDVVLVVSNTFHRSDIQFEAGDTPRNPYVGLSAFSEKDAAFFFGREKFTNVLFEMVHCQPLVPVIGASGSGKSSVVFAGLIPLLREEGIWLIESFRPKSQPFDELALALVRQLEPNIDGVEKVLMVGKLAESLKKGEVTLHQVAPQILENKPSKRFLLIVDQFEELYTQCLDKHEQQCFIDTLLVAVQKKIITLVFTLRADFYGYILSYRPFSDALQQIAFTPLGLMAREELKAAVEQPAQKLNVQLQIHLAERILDDVGNEPGNLPLLEFALTQLWDKQKDGELTHKAYEDIGGAKQALVKHAEQIYSRLSNSQQQQAQQVFLALVMLGDGTEYTRRVATQEEIGKQNWELVTYLAGSEARLLVTGRNDKSGEETVEVVHEALIREWKRLQDWLSNNREKLIQQRKIEAAAIEWRDKGKSKDYLLVGKQLNEANAFQKEQASFFTLSSLASEFIQKSIKYRWNNRLRLVCFGLIPLVTLSIFLGFIGVRTIRISQLRSDVDQAKGQQDSYKRFKALEELVELGEPLNNIELKKVNLTGAKLYNANFTGANLTGANLTGAKLDNANLDNANLDNANLSGASLSRANLSGASLSRANLSGANLSRANLSGANLSGANLDSASLSRANLSGANLDSANLDSASLSRANLSGANLDSANLQRTQYTDKSTSPKTCSYYTDHYPCPTTFPPNFDPKAHGMKLLK